MNRFTFRLRGSMKPFGFVAAIYRVIPPHGGLETLVRLGVAWRWRRPAIIRGREGWPYERPSDFYADFGPFSFDWLP